MSRKGYQWAIKTEIKAKVLCKTSNKFSNYAHILNHQSINSLVSIVCRLPKESITSASEGENISLYSPSVSIITLSSNLVAFVTFVTIPTQMWSCNFSKLTQNRSWVIMLHGKTTRKKRGSRHVVWSNEMAIRNTSQETDTFILWVKVLKLRN